MKLTSVPENLTERLALWLNIAPTPVSDTMLGFMLARTVMVAVKLGILEALADQPKTTAQVSAQCATDAKATRILLNTLVQLGYVQLGENQYTLTPQARKWLLKDSKVSLRDKMLLQFLEWDFVEHYEDYLRTGQPLNYHYHMNSEQWEIYQRGMRSMAEISAWEIGKRTPVPAHATHMLDIGGAHGFYSIELCQRYPKLQSTILELPDAIEHAQPILAEKNPNSQVRYQAGNALTDDLGEGKWDLVFMSSLAHHFDENANAELANRVARALRPGGYYIVQDLIRTDQPKAGDHLGGLLNMYFAATSEAGTYSEPEIQQWQKQAGLVPQRSVWLRSVPRHAQIVAKKM
jgi:SAM-dependent methyltransferase